MFRGLAFFILLLTAGSLQAQVPHTFQAGQPARATEVNENFQTLWQGVATSVAVISVEGREASSGDGLAGVQCPVDTLPMSASCSCNNVNGTRNFGVLFACEVAGNGALAACFDYLWDPSLPPTQATVRAQCLGGRANDGTPLVRLFGMEMKTHSDEFGQALNAVQNQLDDYRVRQTP